MTFIVLSFRHLSLLHIAKKQYQSNENDRRIVLLLGCWITPTCLFSCLDYADWIQIFKLRTNWRDMKASRPNHFHFYRNVRQISVGNDENNRKNLRS